jgi:hypothetical protein
MTEFTSDEYKIIHKALQYYQIHGSNKEHETCSSVLDKIFPMVYTQRQEQQT